MSKDQKLSALDIRAMREDFPKLRDRDFADKLGITEAELVAAYVGQGTTLVQSHPDAIIEAVTSLGEVMALTRNVSCVNEKVGVYDNYRSGGHAAMVLSEEIDLRIFPNHWRNAFFVEKETEQGLRRSVQVFDAAGDAVHKVFLRGTSNTEKWDDVRSALSLTEQTDTLELAARQPTEPPKVNPEKTDVLLKEWARMTDTHQFMRLTSKLRMNRLGAYRSVSLPWVRPMKTEAVDLALKAVSETGTNVMIFTGNKGCIQIHSGPCNTLRAMGPWQNVMDPRFNLHLRLDHIAEVYVVKKPTQRGPAVSLEAFDADGGTILQIFGISKEGSDSRPAWEAILADLPELQMEAVQ